MKKRSFEWIWRTTLVLAIAWQVIAGAVDTVRAMAASPLASRAAAFSLGEEARIEAALEHHAPAYRAVRDLVPANALLVIAFRPEDSEFVLFFHLQALLMPRHAVALTKGYEPEALAAIAQAKTPVWVLDLASGFSNPPGSPFHLAKSGPGFKLLSQDG